MVSVLKNYIKNKRQNNAIDIFKTNTNKYIESIKKDIVYKSNK